MIKSINLQKIIYILSIIIIVFIPAIKLSAYILYLSNVIIDPFIVNQVYLLWILIPIMIIIYIYGLKTKQYKFNYIDIFIYILIILAFISTYMAIDIDKSILGEYKRNEGLLSLLSYYLIFLNVKNINNKKNVSKIISLIMIIGVIQVVYSCLQVYTNFDFIKHYSKPYMAMGLCGNPNFLGSYMVMLCLISFVLFILNKTKKHLFLTILFFIGICLSSSTGPFLGFILTLLTFIILYYKKIELKSLLVTLFILFIVYFIVDVSVKFVHTSIFNNEIEESYNITSELSKSISNYKLGNLGNGRLNLWLNALPLSKKYWIHGAGLDNFGLIYPQSGGIYVDKAHNIYLQILLTNGLFALICYCGLCLITFIKGLKIKDTVFISIFMAFIGYSIQAFANISVIDVAPLFFIILGLLYTYIK